MRWCCNRPVCIWASADADSNPICGAPTQYYNYSPLPSLPSAVVVAWRVAPSADLWEADPTMEVSHKERQVVEWEASPGKPATPPCLGPAVLPPAAAARQQPPPTWVGLLSPSLPCFALRQGSVTVDASTDWTLKVDVAGLSPTVQYWCDAPQWRLFPARMSQPRASFSSLRQSRGCTPLSAATRGTLGAWHGYQIDKTK